jgi:hypothetical protein
LAERIVEIRDEKDYIFPAVFESNNIDPVPVMPCDLWDSFAFWTKTGTANFILNDAPNKNPVIRYDVSCIFYVDMRKISPLTSYKETRAKLTEDIFHFFNTVKFKGQLKQIRFIDDDITKVYDGFSIEQIDNRFRIYPKWACRIDLELYFRDSCYVTNNYA